MSCLSCIWGSQTPPKSLPDKHNDFVYLERQDKETLYSKRSRGHQPKTPHGMLYGGVQYAKTQFIIYYNTILFRLSKGGLCTPRSS